MSVKKRNGVWYARFWVHQKEFYFTVPEARTKRMAERFERFYRDRVSALLTRYTLDDITIDMIRHSDEHGSLSVTMRELADAYIASRRGKRTFHDLQIKANKLVDYFGPNMLIRTISPLAISRFVQEYRQGRKPASVNRHTETLRAMFNLAVSERWIDVNPVSLKSKSGVPLLLKESNERTRVLSRKEEQRLLPACCEELRPIVIFALDTGCRAGEIFDLTWDCVDFQTNTVRIWQTKTEREKTIPLSSRLRLVLSELRAKAESDRVFPSGRAKDKHLEQGDRYTSVKTAWLKACRRAGITGLRFHDLRATFITRLIESGVDIGTVKALSGHTTLAALQRYIRVSGDAKQRAIEKLSEMAA